MRRTMHIRSLEQLKSAMLADDPSVLDDRGEWRTDLPVFGGPAPRIMMGVWSWDDQRLLIGYSTESLKIIDRD